MTESKHQDIAQLVSEKKALQLLLQEQEKTVREQSSKLNEVLWELQDRARELEVSRDELSSQRRILQSIINSISAGVVVANSAGHFILFNPAAEAMAGVGLTEALPDEWTTRYGCFLPDKVTPYPTQDLPLVRALRGEKVENSYLFIRNPQRTEGVMLLIQASPLLDEQRQIRGGVVVFYDVTARQATEEALRLSERRYADLFLGAPDPIVLLDREGRIQSVNPAVENFSGYTSGELVGAHFTGTGILTSGSIPKAVQEFTKVILGQETAPYEIEVVTRSGEQLVFEAHARQIRTGDEICGVQVIFRHVTARKKSEKRLAVQYAITQILSESSAIQEAAPRVLRVLCENMGWEIGVFWRVDPLAGMLRCVEVWKQPDLEAEEFEDVTRAIQFSLGHGLPGRVWQSREAVWISDVVSEPDFPRFQSASKAGLHGAFAFPVRFQNEVIGVIEFFERKVRIQDESLMVMADAMGKQIGQFLYRKQVERKIMEKNLELARSRAEREHLELFAYAASHDLQEPLQKILGFADLLNSNPDAKLDPKTRDYLERIQNASVRMNHLIADLMKFVKVTAPYESREWVDLAKIVKEVLSDLDHKIKASGARVETGPLPSIKADPRQMHQLFQNLISNALKFRTDKRVPEILVSSRDATLGFVEISVQDNGIGFDEKYLDQIFKPFERLHSKEHYAGSGIGLAICKKIVDHHRGSITAKSGEGKGTVFLIKLPVAASDAGPSILEMPL